MAQRALPPQPQLHEVRTRLGSSSRVRYQAETSDSARTRAEITPIAVQPSEWPPSHEEVDHWVHPELGLGL